MRLNEPARLAELAAKLDCITDEDLALLAGVKLETVVTWRYRGEGPAYSKVGTRALYNVNAVAEWMSSGRKRPAPLAQEQQQ